MEHKLSFELLKETKNTVRYEEQTSNGDEPVIGGLYIQKDALPTPYPTSVKVTVQD